MLYQYATLYKYIYDTYDRYDKYEVPGVTITDNNDMGGDINDAMGTYLVIPIADYADYAGLVATLLI